MNKTTSTAISRPTLLSLTGGLSLFIAFIFVQSLFFLNLRIRTKPSLFSAP